MNSLEQMRSIFDSGGMGLVLIGMPGIEKRIARFPQFYSRNGFVHESPPLSPDEMQALLEQHWTPLGVKFSETTFAPENVARLIRIASDNLRLLTRLLTQIERVLSVNDAQAISLVSSEPRAIASLSVKPDLAELSTDSASNSTTENGSSYSIGA